MTIPNDKSGGEQAKQLPAMEETPIQNDPDSQDETEHAPRCVCGTMLLYSGELKMWGGYESEEAMHAAQGTTPPQMRRIRSASDDLDGYVKFI